ncbi:MAG TPA: hypothetical protein VHT23_07705 [Gemmatimonadaceae bacterium]|jgi:hypothetical protein|nr:hypothetical protein [Gemmatimonadaceae bacterium]
MFRCIQASVFVLALPISVALGLPQERISESRVPLPASMERGFAGEIGYAFDTALNMTRARFKAPLSRRGILSRIFRTTPAVHTLTATYAVAGRALSAPDSIRISLMSDELSQAVPGNGPPPFPKPVLTIVIADSVVWLPLGISQKTVVWSSRESGQRPVRTSADENMGMNRNAIEAQMHIQRTATARLSTCAFLALLAEKSMRGTVAGLEFEINEDVMAGLREFAAGMESQARRCH